MVGLPFDAGAGFDGVAVFDGVQVPYPVPAVSSAGGGGGVYVRLAWRGAGTYDVAGPPVEGEIDGPVSVACYDGAGSLVAVDRLPGPVTGLGWSVEAPVLSALDTYTVVWSATVDGFAGQWSAAVELVGDHLFSVAELRAADRAFEDVERYPDDVLARVRVQVEDVIEGESAAGVAMRPRARRVVVSGSGRDCITVPDLEVSGVYAVSVAGSAWSAAMVAGIVPEDDRLYLPSGVWPAGRRNVVVWYVHGRPRPPAPIRRAGVLLAREYLAGSDLPGRATATTVGDQFYRITVAGRDGVTGLPEVDAALAQHGRRRFGVG